MKLAYSSSVKLAREVADRVWFMDAGRIVETGTPDAFFNRPQTARAQKFLAEIRH